MNSGKKWRVRLGDVYWTSFTYARTSDAGVRLLGSIARGAQMGALGVTADGQYVQVNGDHITLLSNSQVRRAIKAAECQYPPMRPMARSPAPQPVTVTVKRRRTVVIA